MRLNTLTRLDRILSNASTQYDQQGYVRWPEIAEQEGISRQRVLQVLQIGIEQGRVTADYVQELRGSLEAARVISFKCSSVNREWLTQQAETLNCRLSDVLNRVVTSHRLSTPPETEHV